MRSTHADQPLMEYKAEGSNGNALQRVVFIVQFAKEFTESEFQRFDKEYKEWREDLPRRSVANAVLFQPAANQVTYDEQKVISLSYESLMKDGRVEFGLRFEEGRILFLVGNYTNWKEIWPRAKRHLEQALALVSSSNSIISFAAEYSDLFRASGSYLAFDANEVFRSGSDFIPPHIFKRKENFHFYTGFFETVNGPAQHRVLTRINTDLRDNQDEMARDLSIVLFHQLAPYREPWAAETGLPREVLDRGLENFVDLHEIDKAVLKEVLNDNMSRKIGLLK
jgi:hypothetical protein